MTAINQLFRFHVRFGKPLVVTQHQISARHRGPSDHGFAFRQRNRHRFLAKDVLTGIKRGDGDLGVREFAVQTLTASSSASTGALDTNRMPFRRISLTGRARL